MPISAQDLIKAHPEVGAALQFHQQMQNGGGQPTGSQPQGQPPQPANGQGAPLPMPQQQPQPKMQIPPDIQEREIILNAFAKHLGVLDSVITAKTSQKPPQGQGAAPGQPPDAMLQMAAQGGQ